MRLVIRYFRATFVASALSALPLLVAFAANQRYNLVAVLSAWVFVSIANFFAIGTLGWMVGWISRSLGIFSATPEMALGAIVAGLGWYAFGGLVALDRSFSETGVYDFEQMLWRLMGAASGIIAGQLLVKIGFDADIHKEQFFEERKGQEQNYHGFLSYSRNDESRALLVWRFLDKYRTPKELAGSPGNFGPVPKRLYPVFRDREELASGQALSENLRSALLRSDHLIVLASPASAKSAWVNFEVEEFITERSLRNVFPVIIYGVPNSGDEQNECLPAALHGTDVLAADLRFVEKANGVVHGDGKKIGLLKLVAGLLGVDFAQLQKREVIREKRRYATIISIVALTTSIAFLSIVMFSIASNFFSWTQEVIDAHLRREIEKLAVIHRVGGDDGLKIELQYEATQSQFCRALVDADGVVRFGFFPEPVAKELVGAGDELRFSVRYSGSFEYAGSPFTRRVDGFSRKISDNAFLMVALCNYDPPYFYGSFRSIFGRSDIDKVVRITDPGVPSRRQE